MGERGTVLLGDPERSIRQADDALGVDAVHVRSESLAAPVEARFGRRGLQWVQQATERVAVTILQRDHVGDAEGAVLPAVARGKSTARMTGVG